MSLFGSTFGSNQQQQQQPAGGGLFGSNTFGSNNQQQPQQPSGGLFGSTSTQQQGPSLFGNTTNAAPASGGQPGGLFGSNPSQGGGGGLFGNTQQNQQNQQQPGAGGLFGTQNQNQNQPNTGGGLFGNTQTSSTQPAAGGGLFGNNQNQPATGGGLFGNAGGSGTAASGGGGLFGNTNTNTNTNQPAPSGGLFGNTSTSNTGGGLFGNANTSNNAASGGGGLFGNTNNNANTGGGLFGNNSTSNTGGGLFGNTNAQQQQQQQQPPGGGLFGNANQSTGGGLFGSQNQQQKPATSLGFSSTQPQQQQQQPGSSLFGSTNQSIGGSLFGGGNTLGSSTLGTSTLGGLGQSALWGSTANGLLSSRAVVPSQQQPDPQSQFIALQQRIESIAQAWNSNSPQCRFQHYFYNLVDPAQVHLYGRPPNATNDALWQKAVRENPDPSCLVPVIASGFDDLQQRVEGQTKQAAEQAEKLKEIKSKIEALSQRHQISNTSRLRRASALQTQLQQRVLKVVQHLHLLIPALRSSSIRPEEEALRVALEDIDEEVRRPGGIGKMRAKLNELWALVGALNAAREQDAKEGGVGWAVVDEDGLNQIAQILAEEQAGLAHVTKVLQRDLKDLAVIQGVPPKEDTEPDILAASTASLRSTAMY